MRILQIGSSLYDWGGIERYVAFLAEGLMARGHEVHLTAPPGSLLATRAPCLTHPIGQRAQFDVTTFAKYRRLCREGNYDVVHAHFAPDFVVPARAARSACDATIVMTRHLAAGWKPFKRNAYLSTFDGIIAVSEATRQTLIQSGVPASRTYTAVAGVASQPDADYKSDPAAPFNIGFFGRLTVEKGVDDLIEAAKRLPPNAQVHVYGEGPEQTRLRTLAEGAPVKFYGFVDDVGPSMASMDVIVAPSTWAEAFPFSILEAMAQGKAIVATEVGGIPEQVRHGDNGLLVPPRNPMALADALQQLQNDRTQCEAMGRRSRDIQREAFTIEAFAERIEAVYVKLAAARNRKS